MVRLLAAVHFQPPVVLLLQSIAVGYLKLIEINMELISTIGIVILLVAVESTEDYTYQSGRQIDVGFGFKNSKLRLSCN